MHILLAVLAVVGGAVYWLYRARNAADMAGEIADMGRDAIGAARQWNFKRRTNVHPVDSIDEPRLAAGALAVALVELGGLQTTEGRAALSSALRNDLTLTGAEAEELMVLAPWLIQSCGAAERAVPRLARRLRKLDGAALLDPALAAMKAAMIGGDAALTDAQRTALVDVARTFGRA